VRGSNNCRKGEEPKKRKEKRMEAKKKKEDGEEIKDRHEKGSEGVCKNMLWFRRRS
jgi:hypothetical protein